MQRYFSKNKKENDITLYDSDIYHIKKVMRMKENDNIEVIDDNKLYICKIDDLNNFKLSIIKEIKENKDLKIEIILAMALIKEQKQDFVLQKATELGVNTIIPLQLDRCVVKLDKNKFNKKRIRWETICKEASEQSKRTNIPNITDIMTIKDLEDIQADYRIVLSTKENEKKLNLSLQKLNNCDRIIIVVGPEGGITEKEENYLNSIGYISTSLGSRIMRAETAAIYITSVINYLFMR